MAADRSEWVEELFAKALQLNADASRQQFLSEACGDDVELRGELETLLKAHDAAGPFLKRLEEPSTLQDDRPPAPLPSNLEPPQIAGFRIERKLGEGGLGTVYEARDEKLQRRVALKVLRTAIAGVRRRPVLDEARKAAGLRDPAIVTIHAVLDEQEPAAIVMELVEGFPIDVLAASLTFEQRARALQEIARALGVAHQNGIIHRDLKPANVLLTPALKPVILDFGLALSLEEARQPKQWFEGSPLYASPEQVAMQPLTAASDLFSFGSLMFKVLTGRAPFEGATVGEILKAIRQSTPPFLRDLALGVPEDLQAICLACLAPDPAARPSAVEVALDLGRFLAGEPARLRPALYGDILRKRISEYSTEVGHWERQGMISVDERDRLQVVHRRILADEDHWIIDARRLTLAQTVLYTGTWIMVLAAGLLTWLVRDELAPALRWLLPLAATGILLGVGIGAERRREPLASASFLAGAVLSLVPTTLSMLAELHLLSVPAPAVKQLLEPTFTNQQLLAACLMALLLSVAAQARLRMTGFAWTSCVLGALTYLAALLQLNWLEQKPEIQALWTLPLVSFVGIALGFEQKGRVRWPLPFHLVGLVTLVGALDCMAASGPTLDMFGINEKLHPYLDADRLRYFSFALNGLVFLLLMLPTERAQSLDLRRGSRLLEVLTIPHLLLPLYTNAQQHRTDPRVRLDVSIYLAAVLLLLALGPWRSRWRFLIGALAGVALGSYLLIDLNLVPRKLFVLGLGVLGLTTALAAYAYVRFRPLGEWTRKKPRMNTKGQPRMDTNEHE